MDRELFRRYIKQVQSHTGGVISSELNCVLAKMSRCGVGGFTCGSCPICRHRRTGSKYMMPVKHYHMSLSHPHRTSISSDRIPTKSKSDLTSMRNHMVSWISKYFNQRDTATTPEQKECRGEAGKAVAGGGVSVGMYSYIHLGDSCLRYSPHLHVVLSSVGFLGGVVSTDSMVQLFETNAEIDQFEDALKQEWSRINGFDGQDEIAHITTVQAEELDQLEAYCSQAYMRHVYLFDHDDRIVAKRKKKSGEWQSLYSEYYDLCRIIDGLRGLRIAGTHGYYHAGGRGYRERLQQLQQIKFVSDVTVGVTPTEEKENKSDVTLRVTLKKKSSTKTKQIHRNRPQCRSGSPP